jgi:hypothetical protein
LAHSCEDRYSLQAAEGQKAQFCLGLSALMPHGAYTLNCALKRVKQKPVLSYGHSTMNLKAKYLGEIEVIFETALGNESGDQMGSGSIHEKKQ